MEQNFDTIRKQIKDNITMLIENNRFDEANSLIDEYFKIVPDDAEAFSMKAVILIQNSKFDEAELVLKNGLKIDENYFDLNYNIAFVYEKLNKYEETMSYYYKALKLVKDESIKNEINDRISLINENHKVNINSIQQNKNEINIIKKVLFIQNVPCIRTNKVAKAINDKGIQVDILYLTIHPSEVYKDLILPYKNIYKLQDVNDMIDFINNSDYDVLYSSNEPDYLTVLFTCTNKPIIHDTHDMMSLRSGISIEETVHEYVANVKSTGNIYVNSMIRDIAVERFKLKDKPILSLHSFIEEEQLPSKYYDKLSKKDGQIHCVFEGGLSGAIGHHRYLEPIFLKLAENHIHVHLHCPIDENYISELIRKSKYIHYEGVASPKDLIVEMTKYDVGLAIFNLTESNKLFLDTAFPNKIWDYLAAGLPIMFADLTSFKQFSEESGVGKVLSIDGNIRQQFKDVMKIKIDKDFLKRKKWTMNEAADGIIKFLIDVKKRYYLNKGETIKKEIINENKYDNIISGIRKTYTDFKTTTKDKIVLISNVEQFKKDAIFYSQFEISGICFLDKVKQYRDYKIIDLNHINAVNYDYIIIDDNDYLISNEVKKNLISHGIDENKIVLRVNIILGVSNIEGFAFKLDEYMKGNNYKAIITGLSYAESGINTDYLTKPTFNFALSGQDIYYDNKILKHIIENTSSANNLEYVIIDLAYYSFGYDLSRSNNKFRVQRYFNTFHDTHNNHNISEIRLLSKIYSKCENNYKYEYYCNSLFNGTVDKKMSNSVINEIKKQSNMTYPDTIKENIHIFEKTLEMLNHNNIKPILVILPVTKYYRDAYDYKQKRAFYDILNNFKSKYMFEVLDYFENKDFNDDEFYDFSHLNLTGAKKFTNLLNSDLSSKYLL